MQTLVYDSSNSLAHSALHTYLGELTYSVLGPTHTYVCWGHMQYIP